MMLGATSSCTRCLRTALALARTPAWSRPYSSPTTNGDDPAADRQERINKLLDKARALKLQHLRNQQSSSAAAAAASASTSVPSSVNKLEQYADALRRKAKEQGYENVEAMRRAVKVKTFQYKAPSSTTAPASASARAAQEGKDAEEIRPKSTTFERKDEELKERLRARAAEKEKDKEARPSHDPSGPVKPLSAIMDLDKLFAPPSDGSPSPSGPADSADVAKLWTTYHTLKNKLSAVIPSDTYSRMQSLSQKYPRFVIPLIRDDALEQGGHEIFYLEWAALPVPTPHHLAPTSSPLPRPTTILFTSLAEYKLRQEFARPAFVLTHYTDLATSHGVVLMRGEVSEESSGAKMLSDAEAQRLCVTLQRFYLPMPESAEGTERSELVRVFHEEPGTFDVQRLIKAATF
ncbi:unnamed protein product [Tilletia controversa]|uniref:ATP11-domain-containing protein n=1 Tax=Tilletia controversa TaxID=13291 RepID=A0A8X7N0Q3_9BASI|nr:hypothetical protein CF328_g227 [Tilletia controversa]KAE8256008.1 hypothetical protein A4X06_0g131 [Tilletia controversa]CAD6934916.1 unnamed protein product [Tilletia controversa]CAD6968397.1 unnamed protein product [Tilletia controversa]CAD6981084.1 unnamed protein product [Tilletia controversa]